MSKKRKKPTTQKVNAQVKSKAEERKFCATLYPKVDK